MRAARSVLTKPSTRSTLALFMLGATFGCSSAPDVDKELDTVRSWSATAQLAAEQHRAGRIPTQYVRQLHDRGVDALGESRTTLAQASHSDAERHEASAVIDSLAHALEQLDREGAPR